MKQIASHTDRNNPLIPPPNQGEDYFPLNFSCMATPQTLGLIQVSTSGDFLIFPLGKMKTSIKTDILGEPPVPRTSLSPSPTTPNNTKSLPEVGDSRMHLAEFCGEAVYSRKTEVN